MSELMDGWMDEQEADHPVSFSVKITQNILLILISHPYPKKQFELLLFRRPLSNSSGN